jgi:hypothetical protein
MRFLVAFGTARGRPLVFRSGIIISVTGSTCDMSLFVLAIVKEKKVSRLDVRREPGGNLR